MSDSRWRWWLYGVVVLAMLASTIALPSGEAYEAPLARLFVLLVVAAGVVALRQEDGRRIGWLLIAMGLTTAVIDIGSSYALAAYQNGWPGALLTQWFINWFSISQFALLIALILVFPTGRPQGPVWRRLFQALVVAAIASMALSALDPSVVEVGDDIVVGPPPVAFETPVFEAIAAGLAFSALAIALAGIVGIILRYRRAVGTEKAQLRLFVFGGSLTLAIVLAFIASSGIATATGIDIFEAEWLADLIFGSAVLCIPIAILVAMARYRLYDIDRIISRTVAYAIVVLVLAMLYTGMAVAPVAIAGQQDSPDLLVAAATLVAAAMFRPLARRVRTLVDRRFARSRYDAARTLGRLAAHLRDQVDDVALRSEVVDAVTATMQPASAWIWVPDAQGEGATA